MQRVARVYRRQIAMTTTTGLNSIECLPPLNFVTDQLWASIMAYFTYTQAPAVRR